MHGAFRRCASSNASSVRSRHHDLRGGRFANPRSPCARFPASILNRGTCTSAACWAATSASSETSAGQPNSTAQNPASAAACTRSTNGSSLNRNDKFADHFNIATSAFTNFCPTCSRRRITRQKQLRHNLKHIPAICIQIEHPDEVVPLGIPFFRNRRLIFLTQRNMARRMCQPFMFPTNQNDALNSKRRLDHFLLLPFEKIGIHSRLLAQFIRKRIDGLLGTQRLTPRSCTHRINHLRRGER